MIVVGIDPSLTSAGIAILEDGKLVHVSHCGYGGHNGASWQARSRRSRHQCHRILTAAHTYGTPDLVAIEEHPYAVRHSGHEFDRIVCWGGLYGAFDARNIPVAVIHPGTLKLWTTGSGRSSKADMVATVQAWFGITVANDDEADALALAVVGAFHLGEPMPFAPKLRHTSGLAKVQWPSISCAKPEPVQVKA